MLKVTVGAETEEKAIKNCQELYGWTPDAVREVESKYEESRAWMCFESADDAELWDRQV